MRFEKHRAWVSLGVALLTSTALTSGAPAVRAEPTPAAADRPHAGDKSGFVSIQLAAGKAGESGEAGEAGEAGEGGERGSAASLARSKSAYLTQLGFIRGHLRVGVELYRVGDAAAATHMKHPEDELYATLKPALKKRRAPGFEKELGVLASRVEKKAPRAQVDAAYEAVVTAIVKAEKVVPKLSRHDIGEIIHNLVRTAAAEYSEAVENGKIVESHEYQDALGFVLVAEDWLKKLATSGADAAVVGEIRNQIASIKPAWPAVVPPQSAAVDPSQIHGAAARIEIAVLGLKK
jgi:hypothetical protein